MSTYRCQECGYTYCEEQGDDHEGYRPGTPFSALPEDFTCPDCAVRRKEEFEEI